MEKGMNCDVKLCGLMALLVLLKLSCGRVSDPYPTGVLELGYCGLKVFDLTHWEQSGSMVHGTGKDDYDNAIVFDGELYPDGQVQRFKFLMGPGLFAEGEFHNAMGKKTGEVRVYNEIGPASIERTQSHHFREDGLIQLKYYKDDKPHSFILRSGDWRDQLQQYSRLPHHLERLLNANNERPEDTQLLNITVKIPITIPPDIVYSFEIQNQNQLLDCGWFLNLNQPNLFIETELPAGPHTFRYRIAKDNEAENDEEWKTMEFEVPVGGGVVQIPPASDSKAD
ncbi:MAG: hypothetical protein HQ519_10820 [Planctomycetes bacterium]|nr:hypothetical protein [Planctomycetota bacterium]